MPKYRGRKVYRCFNPKEIELGLHLKDKAPANRAELRSKAIFSLGGVCAKCGFSDIRALQIDHVNGGGKKEHDSLGRYEMYKKAIEQSILPKGLRQYQVLCANCNWIKRYENKEHGQWTKTRTHEINY